ncbi:hypothetical protein ACFVJ5_30655 [Nocardia sp. NPDC127606]|uniref:hypothetical protein n=1 Tax=Nocardia sp. NPDC127606 TaxID=3345406 RepID=UPI003638FF85
MKRISPITFGSSVLIIPISHVTDPRNLGRLATWDLTNMMQVGQLTIAAITTALAEHGRHWRPIPRSRPEQPESRSALD